MDGWMDGWGDGSTECWLDGWIDGSLLRLACRSRTRAALAYGSSPSRALRVGACTHVFVYCAQMHWVFVVLWIHIVVCGCRFVFLCVWIPFFVWGFHCFYSLFFGYGLFPWGVCIFSAPRDLIPAAIVRLFYRYVC